MLAPLVDVILPVHSRTRPIARSAGSVLDGTKAPVRVNVIAHNIDPEIIRHNLGKHAADPRLRLLSLQDGIASPAGPMNYGLDQATAPFVTLLGSDDEFEHGLIDSWLAMQHSTGAEAVLAKIQEVLGVIDPYPPVRFGRRTKNLHPRRDRLSYRSAPLGLFSRERFQDLRFSAGLKSGEDLVFSLTVWFTAKKLAYDLRGPRYIGHGDAVDRVTRELRSLAEDFAYLDEIDGLHWFQQADERDRVSIAVKLLRIHFFDALVARAQSEHRLDANRLPLIAMFDRIAALGPGATKLLSRADVAVVDELRRDTLNFARINDLLQRRLRYRSFSALLPRNPLLVAHPQAPLRTLGAGFRVILKNR